MRNEKETLPDALDTAIAKVNALTDEECKALQISIRFQDKMQSSEPSFNEATPNPLLK